MVKKYLLLLLLANIVLTSCAETRQFLESLDERYNHPEKEERTDRALFDDVDDVETKRRIAVLADQGKYERAVVLCRPYRPQTKGKMERGYVGLYQALTGSAFEPAAALPPIWFE